MPQDISNDVVTVGYIMKPSREEDFSKVRLYIEKKAVSALEKELSTVRWFYEAIGMWSNIKL